MNTGNNIYYIIQMRSGSTRLPNKMTIPFYEKITVPEIIINKLLNKGIRKANIIVATTDKKADNDLVTIIKDTGCEIFRGDEKNVLQRFINAAEQYNAQQFFRICADNPFISTVFIENISEVVKSGGYDYVSYYLDDKTPAIRTHFGFFCEYATLKTLKKVRELTVSAFHQEHVTPFIYENPHLFKIEKLYMPEILLHNQWLRLTVDTKEDFDTASKIYATVQNTSDIDTLIKASIKEGLKEKMEYAIRMNLK